MSGFHLAQFNVARLVAPIDAPQITEFREALDRINALADASPGFVWRATGQGFDSEIPAEDIHPLILANLSVWDSAETLAAFVYRSDHTGFVRRGHEWFEPGQAAQIVLWWIPSAIFPTREEAFGRLDHLRAHGASAEAFDFKSRFSRPDAGQDEGARPMSRYHLAEINIGRLRAPVDSPILADFVANLDRINALADASPGFIWRLVGDGNDATDIKPDASDPMMALNMSVWTDPQALGAFVYRSDHISIMRRRAEWFEKLEIFMALWWVPVGHIPTVEEGWGKVQTPACRPRAHRRGLQLPPPIPGARRRTSPAARPRRVRLRSPYESRRHRLPRLQLRPRLQGGDRAVHRRPRRDGLARRHRAAEGPRPDRPAGRLLLRRLPALRGYGGALADHGRGQGRRGARRRHRRHLQRLPGALRGGLAARRPAAQRPPQVQLQGRRPGRGQRPDPLHRGLCGPPPGDDDGRQWRGQFLRRRRDARPAGGRGPGRLPLPQQPQRLGPAISPGS